jgi:hypothetical protein
MYTKSNHKVLQTFLQSLSHAELLECNPAMAQHGAVPTLYTPMCTIKSCNGNLGAHDLATDPACTAASTAGAMNAAVNINCIATPSRH